MPGQLPGMSQFAALVVELAAKLGAAVPSAKAGRALSCFWVSGLGLRGLGLGFTVYRHG